MTKTSARHNLTLLNCSMFHMRCIPTVQYLLNCSQRQQVPDPCAIFPWKCSSVKTPRKKVTGFPSRPSQSLLQPQHNCHPGIRRLAGTSCQKYTQVRLDSYSQGGTGHLWIEITGLFRGAAGCSESRVRNFCHIETCNYFKLVHRHFRYFLLNV